MIIFGTRKYGWVDEVEGVGTVATTFFHVMFFPLVPTGSHFMVSDDRGVSVPLSMKSVLVAWVRAVLFWTTLGAVISAPVSYGCSCCVALPFGVAYLAMPLLVRRASAGRAEELRRLVGS